MEVLLGLRPLRGLLAAIELPRGDDDLLLGVDEIVNGARLPRPRHRLALRERELLLERPHVEKEDVAAGFIRALAPARDVPCPHVIRHKVAGLDVQVFERQHVVRAHRRLVARDVERHDLLSAAADRIYELELIDPVVVVGLRLDVHLLEPRYCTVARRFDDVNIGRAIFERSDEVFGLAGVGEPVEIGERHAVGIVVDDLQRGGEQGRRLGGQRDLAAVAERHLSARRGPVRMDAQSDVGPGRRVNVAAVLFGTRLQAQRGRIRVIDVDARHARRSRHRDGVGRRRHRAGDHAVVEPGCHRFERQAEGAARLGGHFGRAPMVALADLHLRDNRRTIADQSRFNREGCPDLDARAARRHLEGDA